jgi:hypothetical protein
MRWSKLAKLKVLRQIEKLFLRTGEDILNFDTIMANIDERRSTILGVLSSNKKVFAKIVTNEWQYIPDTRGSIEEMCTQYGFDRDEIEHLRTDDGGLQYSWVRVKPVGDTVSRREFHYLIHTMQKCGEIIEESRDGEVFATV